MMCEIYRKSCISSPDQPSPLPVTHKSKQTMERVIHTHTYTHTHRGSTLIRICFGVIAKQYEVSS